MAVPRRGFEEVAVDPVQLGRYTLLDAIGQARTGTVYRACLRREGKPDELLAIKRISVELSHDARFAERFVETMGRAAQLEHPAHCAIEDVDQAPDGSLYVVMEWVEGKDLAHIAAELNERGQSMPPQLVAYVGAQLADALAAAHAMTRSGQPSPLFHGEIAPEDILIGYDGRVRLTGLGSVALGITPARVGYRAPELARGATCTASSDLFSLGACLYELLSGRPAVAVDPRSSASGPVRRPESHITQVIPRPLEQVVSRALSEQPEARWQSAAELSRALQRWSAAQPGRSDNRALAVFMIALFDSAIADDDKRLRALLARVPPARPQVSGAPLAAPPAVDARHSYARLVRASARPAPSAPTPNWTDASEHTPARGMLMQKLAAEMIVAPAAERPRPTPVTAAAESAKASPSAPAERAPEMPFPDLGAETWDEDSPTHGWVPASELPATRSRPPSHAIMPPAPAVKPAPVIAKAPPLPSRTAPTRSAPAPYSRPPLPLAPPPPALRASARPRPQPRWVVPAIAAAALGVVVAATALLRSGDGALSTIHVHTRPAGAEVYLRGQPIGFTPLQLGELPSGAATVELRAPAYEPATRAIQLEPGKVVLLDVDLIRRAAPAAVPTTPAAQQADLQAQLAAAREVEQRAEPAQSNQAADRDDRRRYHARRASSAAVAAEPEAAPEAAPSPPVKGDVRLDPRSEWKPAPLPGGTAPALRGSASSASATPTAVAPQPSAPPAPRAAASASSGVSRPASLIAQTTPRFPARAKRMGITTGAVTIEYTIDVSGAVKNASVVKADPPGLFDDTSLREIQKWKYRPKLENGTPVETRQRFTFRFSD